MTTCPTTAATPAPTPTTARPRRRLLASIAIVLASALLTLATVAGAGVMAQFNDVPPNHPFFDEIQEVADACIAQGYNDGTYRPNEDVDRQSMAAFLARAGGRVGGSTQIGGASPSIGAAAPNSSSSWVSVAVGGIELPDDGCERTIKLDGVASVYTNQTVGNTCHTAQTCNVEIGLFVGETQVGSAFTRLNDDFGAESLATTARYTTNQSSIYYSVRVRTYNVKTNQAIVGSRTALGTYAPFNAPLPIV